MQQGSPRSARPKSAPVAKLLLLALLAVALSVFLPDSAVARQDPDPQYTNISPLPGGGVAIDRDGNPDGAGAFQINIP